MAQSIGKKLDEVEAAVMEQYALIPPADRAARVLGAMAVGDDDEVLRLRRSCPRKSYTMSDAAYGDRLQFAEQLALTCALDLRHACGRVYVLTLLEDNLSTPS